MLLRRRMMMDTKSRADWDVAWDYTMGLPEENGFEKVISLNPQIEMTGDGLHIIPGAGYVRYTPTGFETCNEGIYEETIIYNSFTNSSTVGNRMILSNGTLGLQIYVNINGLLFNNGSQDNTTIEIRDIDRNREYTIKIERIGGINRIYIDGDKIYETEVVSGNYVTGNRIFFQGGGEYLLKSIKFRKIS